MNAINKFIILLVAVAMSGCGGLMGTAQSSQGTRPVIFLQSGVQLQVFNLCSQTPGRLYPTNPAPGQMEVLVPPGPPTWVPIAPAPFMNTRAVSATYYAYEGNSLVGSVSRSFPIDRNRGTQTVQWILGGDSRGSGRNVVVDRCPRFR